MDFLDYTTLNAFFAALAPLHAEIMFHFYMTKETGRFK